MSFATRLREARKSKNLTQKELADLIGISHGAISNYEKDVSFPNVDILYKIFNILKTEPNFFFQDDINYTTDENLSPKEQKLIEAYRNNPEMQPAINKMLDIKEQKLNKPTAVFHTNSTDDDSATLALQITTSKN